MLNNEFKALTQQVVELVADKLTPGENNLFAEMINQLYLSLNSGNSCLELDVTLESTRELVRIMHKTQLVGYYHGELPPILQPLPFALWEVKGTLLLFLTRYLAYEKRIYTVVSELFATNVANGQDLNAIIHQLEQLQQVSNLPNQQQLTAIITSLGRKFNIITGGPGTGKTTTVTLLLWSLYQLYGKNLKVKICAPTGKAAIRVKSSIISSIDRLKTSLIDTTCFEQLLNQPSSFGTIHKLLGTQQNQIYFRHNQTNPLDVEVLIIDESSMVGLPLFSKLITAVNLSQIKHVILLGDKNQLSSVEEGYVFASLVNLPLASGYQRDLFEQNFLLPASELVISNRNNQLIANLAEYILQGDAGAFIQALMQDELLLPLELSKLVHNIVYGSMGLINYIDTLEQSLDDYQHSIQPLFDLFTLQVTLCATNQGYFGIDNLNQQIEHCIKQHYGLNQEWYTGRPIMILQNDYSLDLFNGDIGICMLTNGIARIYFENGKVLIPEILPRYKLAYTITIHKSQGSEYRHVNIVLPQLTEGVALFSRELLYTAVTRAKHSVNIFSTSNILQLSILNPTIRSSGLGYM